MKKYQIHSIIIFIILWGTINFMNGQVAISINSTTNTPDKSTILDTDFTENKNLGILIPFINLTSYSDATTVLDPADYLLVFSINDDTSGVNLWNPTNSPASWDYLITNNKLTEIINNAKIPQVVLSANQSVAETTNHITNSNNSTPYVMKLDAVSLDSREAYDTTTYGYTIPEDGTYEITCNTTIIPATANTSQTFIGVNGTYNINSLLATTTKGALNPNNITTIDSYTTGTIITCAVGFGTWNKGYFYVTKGSIKIIKY